MALTPGTVIGPYRIVEQLGKGGMATVYKAHQAALARYVAIKVLPEFLAETEGFSERFQQEAVAVAKLRHPNILAVFDYGTQDSVTYIVNEYVDGGDLGDQLGSPLPVRYVADTLAPVASALDYAHSRGILHRDVKPQNVLLTHEGTPILADFGLAKILDTSGPGLTQGGMIVGTPEYMSPEQCEGVEIGPAADIYSLAVVAYQMLTGKLPFSAATPAAVIMAQLHHELPPPRSVNPDLSEPVEQVLLKGLAREPGDRYKRSGEFTKALAEAATAPATVAVRPPPEAAQPASGPPEPEPPPRPDTPGSAGLTSTPSAPPAGAGAMPPPPPPSAPPTPAYTPPAYTPPAYGAAGYGQGSQPYGAATGGAYDYRGAVGGTATAATTPQWVAIVLIVGAVVCGLFGLLFIAFVFDPSSDTRLGAVVLGVPLLLLTFFQAWSAGGLLTRRGWARGLTWAAAVMLCFTCVGAIFGAPIIYGLLRKPRL